MSEESVKYTESEEIEQLFSEVDDLDKRIMNLRIQFPGMPKTTIGKKCGVSAACVSDRLNKVAVKKALADYENRDLLLAMDNRRRVMKLQQKAIQAIEGMLDSDNPQEKAFALDKIDIMKGIIPDLSEVTATHNIPNSIKIEFEGDE